jgi:hypothetical protein
MSTNPPFLGWLLHCFEQRWADSSHHSRQIVVLRSVICRRRPGLRIWAHDAKSRVVQHAHSNSGKIEDTPFVAFISIGFRYHKLRLEAPIPKSRNCTEQRGSENMNWLGRTRHPLVLFLFTGRFSKSTKVATWATSLKQKMRHPNSLYNCRSCFTR